MSDVYDACVEVRESVHTLREEVTGVVGALMDPLERVAAALERIATVLEIPTLPEDTTHE